MSTQMEVVVRLTGDRSETARVVPRDLVAFERHYSCSFLKVAQSMTFEQTLYLAHRALRRTQKFTGDFEAFIDEVESFDDVEGEEKDPQTPPG